MSFLDTVLSWFGGADTIAGKMLDAVNHGTTVINVKDGSLGSGGKALVGYVLEEVGRSLINATVPSVSGLSEIVNNGARTYLSKSLATALRENLVGADGNGGIKRSIGEIADNEFIMEYKRNSKDLIRDLVEEVENYIKLFDVFTVTKRYKIWSVRSGYDEIWRARKEMKKCLGNMIKKVDAYTPDNYKAKRLREGKINAVSGDSVEKRELQEQLAYLIYLGAWKFFNRYADRQLTDILTNPRLVQALEAFKKDPNGNIPDKEKDKLIEMMYLLEGTPDAKFGQNLQPPSREEVRAYLGYKFRCVTLAEEGLAQILPAAAAGIVVNSPLMGDYALQLKQCFEYTQQEIDKAINIGAKRNHPQPAQPPPPYFRYPNDKGKGAIDLKRLLGESEYRKEAPKLEALKSSLDDTVNKGYLREVDSAYSQAKKEYKYIRDYKDKYFPDEIPHNYQDPYVNFKNLTVELSSRSNIAGRKGYRLDDQFALLKDFYDEAMRNQNSIDHVTLCLRKTKKFLLACQVWNDKKKDYERYGKVMQRERQNATDIWYKQIKEHYNELCQVGKRINQRQKQADPPQNKNWKKLLDKAYKKFPYLKRNFMKHFDEYKRMAEAFCYLGIRVDGSGLTKYAGLNEQQNGGDCLNDDNLDGYFDAIKGVQGQDELNRIDLLAKAARRAPWRPAADGQPQ